MLNYTSRQFYEAQMGMTREVLTNYGAISRMWWDHYRHPCETMCPCDVTPNTSSDPFCFPAAWANFTELIRELSPNTLIGTGPDISHSGGNGTWANLPWALSQSQSHSSSPSPSLALPQYLLVSASVSLGLSQFPF